MTDAQRTAHTAPARAGRLARYRERARALMPREATDAEIARCAETLYHADLREASLKAADARRLRARASQLEAEAAAMSDGGDGDA